MKSKSISTFSKFLSVFLSVLIVAYTVPVSVYADLIDEIREMTAGTSESSDNSGGDLVVDPYELVELREENVKHFRGEDGLSVAVQYDVPVHTKDSAGRWQDIDNTLSSAGSEYATSNARIKFAKKITGNEVLFTLHDGNRKLTLSLDGAIKKTTGKAINPHTDFDESATTLQKMMTLDRLSSEITYAGILDGVDLQYVAESVHVKENIIVKKLKDSYSYTFTLKLNNLTAELCEDGSVEILDSDTSAVIYTIPAGYMFDAAGEFSDAVSYTLVPNGKNSYAFTVTADAGWINAPDRVFPVTVDPTVMTKSESDDTTDTYVDESTPNGYYNNKTFVAVGSYTGAGHDFISYWNGPMPEIPAGAYVSKVTLNYYCQNYRQNDANDPNLYIEAYPVTSSWTGKITWNQYVNKTRGTLSGTPVDYVKLTPENGTGTTFSWNITDIAKKWYDGTAEKYGIALKQNGSAKNSALLTSSDGASCNHPSVCVTYKNTFGLESYWSTLSQSAGIAGSGYVNPATGSLTLTKGLLSTTDSLMPYTPNLIYNSALSGKDYEYPNVQISYWGDYMPLGFKLNIQETIIKKNYTDPENNTVAYYIWADSDGTEHSFLPVEGKSNEYRDEDGLQLVLNTANDSALTITDDSKTVKTFGKLSGTPDSTVLGGWYLTSIADKNGNTVSFTFDSGKRPTKVSLTPNGSSRIDFLTIVYNSSYMPSMIRNDSTKEAIIFRYSATPTGSITTSGTKYLRQIDYAHGNSGVTAANWTNFYNNASSKTNITLDATASYSYDAEGRIAVAKDQLSGYEVRYTYSSAGKVTAIEEYAGSTAGQKIGITYYSGYTEIRNSGSDDVYGNSDDLISCYAFDENGRSVSIYSTDASHTQIYGATAGEYESEDRIKNNIKSSTAVGGSATNYLLNGGFESLDSDGNALYWTKSSSRVEYGRTLDEACGTYEAVFLVASGNTDTIRQYTKLSKGTYTLSMNVNTFDCKNVRMYVAVQSLSDSSPSYSEEVPVNEYYASGQTAFFSTSFEVAGASEAFEIIVKVVGGSIASGQEASVSVDNLMLEKNIGNSAYSLVQLGNFENFSVDSSGTYLNYSKNFWTNTSGNYVVRNVGAPFGLSAYLTASLTGERYMKQTLYQAPSSLMAAYDNHNYYGESAKTYIVSGFGRGTGQVANPDAAFRIRVDVTYYMGSGKDDIVVPFCFDFQTGCKDWQFVCGNVETADNYMVRSIVLYCEYSYQPIGYALFDEIAFTESTDESVVKYEYYGKEIAGDQRPANSALDGLLRLKKSGYYTEIYEYDNERRLTRVANNRGEIHDYSYAANSDNIANEIYYKFRQGNNGPRIYPYLTSNPDELITKVPQTKTSYTYNAYGQAQTVKTYEAEYNSSGNVTLKSGTKNIYSHKQYNVTSGSKYFGALLQEIDGLGRSTQYYYDANSGRLLACISINEKSGTCYSYDALGNIRSVLPAKYSSATAYSPVSGKESVDYTYNESNLLESITTGSTTYNFTYNVFGNADTVSVGEAELASYEYNAYNGKLNKVHYGNGFSVRYVYDKLDNVKEIWYKKGSDSEVKAYAYSYTAQGQLYRFENLLSGKNTVYKYDTAGKLIAFIEYDGDEMVNEFSSSMYYNDEGKLQMVWYSLDYSFASGTADHSPNYFYSYNPDGSLKNTNVDAVTATGNIQYSYDSYNRLTGKTSDFYLTADSTKRFTNTVGYTFSSSGSYTSAQVASYTSKVNSNAAVTYTYTYDGNGNITKITTTSGDEIRYVYDDLGQLIREDNAVRNQTYVYTYDNAGNILSKKTYALTAAGSTPTSPTGTNTYGYGNASWGDLLTSFNGNAITYDAIGNPLSYNNGTSYTYNFTWENGRRLASATYGSNTITYTYNDEGTRTSKNVSGTEHVYHLDGSRIIAEEWGNSLCIYLYDAEGTPVGMQYRAKGMAEGEFYTFWFEKNLQGDIIAVYNDSGVKTLSYSYDAWGNATVTRHNATGKNSYATYNPFRYRGYYYDTETGFYYLQSRYYDPNTGRFVNADTSSALTASPLSLTDKNLFSYCDNNPVARSDYDGEFWHIVIGAVVGAIGGAVSSIVSQAISGEEINWKAVGISAASGGVSGAITAACPCMSPILTGVVQGGISAATYAATEKIAYGRDPSLKDVIEVGVTSGVMAGGMQYVGQELGFVQCFIAGTLVSTKAGLVPIEEIQPGDLVWASDPETGETALKEVVQLFRNETEEWIHVTVDDEEITCTPNHPFYSPVKGWTSACDLRAGDILVTVNGEYVVVEKVQHELLENPETTYNFEVEGFHTYYVGDTEVLVHNKCKNDYQTKNTTQKSAQFGSEREARNLARTKVGHNPVNVGDGKLRSSDGTWQYRAKPGDILQRHIHLEKLNPMTGEVIINWHLRW